MSPVVSALVSLLAIQILVSCAGLVGPVLAPLAAADLGVDPANVGFYVSGMFMFAASTALVSGGFIARFGAMRMCQVSLVLCAIGLASAASGKLWLVPLSAITIGAGLGPSTPSSSQILARVAPPHLLNVVFAIKQTGVPLGSALAGVSMPVLAVAYGWHSAALFAAAGCIAMAIAVQPLRTQFDSARDRTHRLHLTQQILRPIRLLHTSPAALHIAIVAFVYGGVQMLVSSILVVFLVQQVAMDPVPAGFVLSFTQIAAGISRVVWASLADRYVSPYRMLGSLGLVAAVCALVATTFAPGWPFAAVLGVCLVLGISSTGWNGIYLAQIARLAPPGRAGELTGGSTLYSFGGVVVMPAIFSTILSATGSYPTAFVAMALPTFAAAISMLRRPEEPQARLIPPPTSPMLRP